jgi:uncharacterized protein YoxC
MGLITVKEYAEKKGYKPSYIYNLISQNRIEVLKKGRSVLIEENAEIYENPLEKNDIHMISHEINDNRLLSIVEEQLEELKTKSEKEIHRLQNSLDDLRIKKEEEINLLHKEIKRLNEELRALEKEQKDEIKTYHQEERDHLKAFMDMLSKQTQNILEHNSKEKNPQKEILEESEEAIIVQEEPQKERLKPSKFFKLMAKKGYSKDKAIQIIKKRLKKKDDRFEVINGETIIYKNNFKDL